MKQCPSERLKRCIKCGAFKPRAEFYPHPAMRDGLLRKCKDCTRKDVSENRHKKLERYRAYDRARGWRPGEPHKVHARRLVRDAVKWGRLVKPDTCADCGKSAPVEGHHEDYSKPLDVVWVCRPCHGLRHRRTATGESANGQSVH